MRAAQFELPGLVLLEPKVLGDARGYFFESYNRRRYAEAGVLAEFVQDNISSSRRGVLRGLHYQNPHGQAKLVSVLEGEVFDVAVDIRTGSPTFGKWAGVALSSENKRQLFIPAGFAHGFCVLSEVAVFHYKVDDYWHPEAEGSVRWNDPTIGIRWPIEAPVVSDKDGKAPLLSEVDAARLPAYPRPSERVKSAAPKE